MMPSPYPPLAPHPFRVLDQEYGLPAPIAGPEPTEPFPFKSIGQMPPGIPADAKAQNMRDYLQQQSNIHKREEQIRMSPEDFNVLTQEILSGPLFADQRAALDQNQKMAAILGKIPATPDLSPIAGLLGLSEAPYKGSSGGMLAAMDLVKEARKERMGLSKEAIKAAGELVIGKDITTDNSLSKLLERFGLGTGKTVDDEGRKGIAFLKQDFMKHEIVKESLPSFRAGYQAYSALKTNPTSPTVRLYAQKILAKALEKGKLTDTDFYTAGPSRTLSESWEELKERLIAGKTLPSDVEKMTEAALIFMRIHGTSIEDVAGGMTDTANTFYTTQKTPQELKAALLQSTGQVPAFQKLKLWEKEAAERPKPVPTETKYGKKIAPPIDVKSMLLELKKEREKGK